MCQHLNLDYTIYVWVDWFYHWVLVLQYLILDSSRDWICRPESPKSAESGLWKLKSVAVAIQPVTVMMIRKHLLGQLVIQSACIQTCNSNFKTIFNLLTDRLPDCLGPGPRGSGLAWLGSAWLGLAWAATAWVSESELATATLFEWLWYQSVHHHYHQV